MTAIACRHRRANGRPPAVDCSGIAPRPSSYRAILSRMADRAIATEHPIAASHAVLEERGIGMPWLRDSQLSLADRLRRLLLMLGLAVAMVAGSPLWESWGAPIGLSPDGAGTAAGSVAPLPGALGEPKLAAAAKHKRNAQDKDTAGKHRSNKTNEPAKDQSDKTDTPGNKDRSKREGK